MDFTVSPKVMLDFFAVPQVAERIASKGPPAPQMLINVPGSTRKNVYIHPFHLDLSDTAKYGIGGKWPSNVQIKAHFPSIVSRGYESEREALEIKFPPDLHMSGKPLPPFRVQFIDGHCKATMIVGVFALLDYMVSCLGILDIMPARVNSINSKPCMKFPLMLS